MVYRSRYSLQELTMINKTYDPKSFEDKWYRNWLDAGCFACQPESKATPYTIMMPPPNVTGSLHIGHALTFTLQDILIRFHRMQGRDVLWQPGMDHAGIATQMVVERQLAEDGLSRREIGREAFIDKIWQWKKESGGTISRQLRSLGASPDWARERFTLDAPLSQAVRVVFVELYKQGLIYRDKRLINWDPKLKTAISDLEVEQREVDGFYWHIRYAVENSGRHITIVTTRPETMFGDTAVAVHPDDERYQDLIGKNVILPISGRCVPMIADEHADMEKGSGVVKITPAHDFNDFEVGKRHHLPMINIFDEDARLNEAAPSDYQGMDRFEARAKLIKYLEAENLLVNAEVIKHTVPHGDRSGVPIEPWLMDQWYVDAETLAKPAIKAVEEGRTKIIPQRWEKTYFEWMRNIQPWCISRQLWWGHRIPAWHAPDGEIFVAMDESEAAGLAKKHYGYEVALTQDEDVLDTWFSSGLWPFSTLGWPEDTAEVKRYYPGDVLVTGFDIIFFWVARMMMLGIHFMDGGVPFKDVYIHALVRDEKGQKMSKSKGNVMDPLDLSQKYGADALRFTLVAMAAQGRDIKLAENRIEGYRNFATKIWNACRFLQMNDATSSKDFTLTEVKNPLNRWIVHETLETERVIRKSIETYRFNEAADAIYHFIWNSYCDWYLELIKPQMEDVEVKQTVAAVMAEAMKMLHPFMPFITEELWHEIFGSQEMLATSLWPEHDAKGFAEAGGEAAEEIRFVIALITAIRSLRNEMNVPSKATPDLVILAAGNDDKSFVDNNLAAIKRLARVDAVVFADHAPPQSAQGVAAGITFALPLAEVLDFDAERTRLKKELGATEVEIKKLESKMSNQGFLSKAPGEVIEENKRRLRNDIECRDRIANALERLK